MTVPIMASNKKSTAKITVLPGVEWVTPTETREIKAVNGARVLVKITKGDKVTEIGWRDRAGTHRWIKDKGAIKYEL